MMSDTKNEIKGTKMSQVAVKVDYLLGFLPRAKVTRATVARECLLANLEAARRGHDVDVTAAAYAVILVRASRV